jgi:hypothetical protein
MDLSRVFLWNKNIFLVMQWLKILLIFDQVRIKLELIQLYNRSICTVTRVACQSHMSCNWDFLVTYLHMDCMGCNWGSFNCKWVVWKLQRFFFSVTHGFALELQLRFSYLPMHWRWVATLFFQLHMGLHVSCNLVFLNYSWVAHELQPDFPSYILRRQKICLIHY